jgi:drug/metabolite transporter (DMT)-like permease
MKRLENSEHTIAKGIGLMLIGTLCGSGADATLKAVASDYAAPQILFIAALTSMFLSLLANRTAGFRQIIHTGAPWAMAGRSVATVVAALGFYQAFVRLPFADVFLFIGVMPLLAAVFSGFLLGERPAPRIWGVLCIGLLGMVCLFPFHDGVSIDWAGHSFAAMGSVSGTFSVVLSRHIGRHDTHSLAQVFIPQMTMAVVMGLFLPLVAQPMTFPDLALVLLYALLVFGGRWIMVIVSRLLPAWLSLQLLNLQFVWMVALGYFVFSETTHFYVFIGAALIILAGVIMARDEILRSRTAIKKRFVRDWQEAVRDDAPQVRVVARAGP